VPLAVEAGAKLPQEVPPQVTVHFTPALLLSLLTIAVRLAVVAAISVVGGVELKATEIAAGGGVGGVLEPPPLQAVSPRVTAESAKSVKKWIARRVLIECLR
jgi:hypothetical protein